VSEPLFREGTPMDLPAAAALWRKLQEYHAGLGLAFPVTDEAQAGWLASFEKTLGRFSFLWVADLDGRVAGFLLARIKRAPAFLSGQMVGEISDLWVEPELRGQHAGERLVNLATQKLHDLNVHSIEVQIMAQNESGIAFWKSQGYDVEIVQVRRALRREE